MLLQIALFHYFLWLSNTPLYLYAAFSLKRYLGFFHVLAIVNSAAANTGVHASFRTVFSSGYVPRSGAAGSYGGAIFRV